MFLKSILKNIIFDKAILILLLLEGKSFTMKTKGIIYYIQGDFRIIIFTNNQVEVKEIIAKLKVVRDVQITGLYNMNIEVVRGIYNRMIRDN